GQGAGGWGFVALSMKFTTPKPLTISQPLVIPCKMIIKSAEENDGSEYEITLSFNVLAGETFE
ncbi:MAG: hypothetical protein OXI77_05925, partial [Chloroflexota bacterium]|nr:hypothetical protein [Chloroflexota bacterium]MDE2910613.1 hypothetical protein [Chloroflexota bacterium]